MSLASDLLPFEEIEIETFLKDLAEIDFRPIYFDAKREVIEEKPFNVYIDEGKDILTKLLRKAASDYLTLYNTKVNIEKWYYITAVCFLFEEGYTINWGGSHKTLEDICDILDIDHIWFREKLREKRIEENRKRAFTRLLYD